MRTFSFIPAISAQLYLQEIVRTFSFKKIIITFLPLIFDKYYFGKKNNITTPIFRVIYNLMSNYFDVPMWSRNAGLDGSHFLPSSIKMYIKRLASSVTNFIILLWFLALSNSSHIINLCQTNEML